jgi:hypothetical protein
MQAKQGLRAPAGPLAHKVINMMSGRAEKAFSISGLGLLGEG